MWFALHHIFTRCAHRRSTITTSDIRQRCKDNLNDLFRLNLHLLPHITALTACTISRAAS
eukprot:m.1662040 g.1662040  ORF g.1662040 m.1662040 type:complete len:60 (+) comp127881_c0_seq1:79-258(+)